MTATASGSARRTTTASGTRAAKPRPAAAPRTAPPAPPEVPRSLAPVRLSTARPETEIVYDQPVFSIDDADYCMPSDPPMPWATDYLNGMASGNDREAAQATVVMYRRMLTDEGWEALCAYPQLTRGEFRAVLTIVQECLNGGLDLPKDASDD